MNNSVSKNENAGINRLIGKWCIITGAISRKVAGWGKIERATESNGVQILFVKEVPIGNIVPCFRYNAEIFDKEEEVKRKFSKCFA